ncbi:putative rossmann-like alpha/beta/alpha sandwich protein [Helianthus annuus]|nr:putative rossmann-like alpha/beta/alpha sandwich protein [Helianthus annuus]KAJ0805130.1 putative rossmann-like alpha/beta/alpha sandwich protein [Helianthus annuus]
MLPTIINIGPTIEKKEVVNIYKSLKTCLNLPSVIRESKMRSKLGGFNSMRTRVQVRSPSPRHKKSYSLGRLNDGVKTVAFSGSENSSGELNFDISREMSKRETASCDDGLGNKVMVVVDSSNESKGALQWALDHTVQNQDTMILLHVAGASKLGCKSSGGVNQRMYERLYSMKKNIQIKRPEVKVEIEARQGKERGPTIVEAAKQERASLLVLGQRKQSMIRRIRTMWAGKRSQSRAVDYCIQNANCMTIAVRRKNKRHGGYLITTKRHKNFWLLA